MSLNQWPTQLELDEHGEPVLIGSIDEADTVDGLHAAASGADAHVLATDASGNARVDGQIWQAESANCGVIQFLCRVGVTDNVETPVLRITTTNEAGDEDGGFYTAWLRISVQEGAYNVAAPATKAWLGCFTRVMNPTGVGTNNALDTILDGSVNAYNPAGKNIDSLTVSKGEVDEFTVEVRVQVDVSGLTAIDPVVMVHLTLDWQDFRTPPAIVAV